MRLAKPSDEKRDARVIVQTDIYASSGDD